MVVVVVVSVSRIVKLRVDRETWEGHRGFSMMGFGREAGEVYLFLSSLLFLG